MEIWTDKDRMPITVLPLDMLRDFSKYRQHHIKQHADAVHLFSWVLPFCTLLHVFGDYSHSIILKWLILLIYSRLRWTQHCATLILNIAKNAGHEGDQFKLLHSVVQHKSLGGCLLSNLLCSLFTNGLTSQNSSVKPFKNADHTNIKGHDELAYQQGLAMSLVNMSLLNYSRNHRKTTNNFKWQKHSASIQSFLKLCITACTEE